MIPQVGSATAPGGDCSDLEIPTTNASETRNRMDAQLVQSAVDGESHATAALVDRYLPSLIGFFHYLGVQEDLIDDLVQETFIKALGNLKNFQTGKSFLSWLTTIGRNTFVDDLRRQKKEIRLLRDCETLLPSGLETQQVVEYESIAELIAGLPAAARFLLEMHVIQEHSFPEIAIMTGEEEGTLRVRFHRLVRRLRLKAREGETR